MMATEQINFNKPITEYRIHSSGFTFLTEIVRYTIVYCLCIFGMMWLTTILLVNLFISPKSQQILHYVSLFIISFTALYLFGIYKVYLNWCKVKKQYLYATTDKDAAIKWKNTYLPTGKIEFKNIIYAKQNNLLTENELLQIKEDFSNTNQNVTDRELVLLCEFNHELGFSEVQLARLKNNFINNNSAVTADYLHTLVTAGVLTKDVVEIKRSLMNKHKQHLMLLVAKAMFFGIASGLGLYLFLRCVL